MTEQEEHVVPSWGFKNILFLHREAACLNLYCEEIYWHTHIICVLLYLIEFHRTLLNIRKSKAVYGTGIQEAQVEPQREALSGRSHTAGSEQLSPVGSEA